MLKIKLSRYGKRKQAHFRIVVNEARDKRDGKYVEMIGHYAPAQTPKILELDAKRYDYWVSQGAQPTDTVAALYKKSKSKNPFPAKKQKLNKKAKARLAAEKEAAAISQTEAEKPAEKPAEPTEETKVETAAETIEQKPAETPAEKTEA